MWLHRSQHNYRQANPQAWPVQLTRSDEFCRHQFWPDYRCGSTSDEFYRFRSVQTTGGCCSCGKPLQWLPVIRPVWSWNLHQRPFHWWDCLGYQFRLPVGAVPVKNPFSGCQWSILLDPGTSTRGLSTGGTVGGTGSSYVPVKLSRTPPQWFPVISPVWYWNPHQRPFHWCDCGGYRFRSCSDHRCGCSEGSPTRSRSDHWPLSPQCRILDRYQSCSGYR